MFVKKLLLVAIGAAGALEAEKLLTKAKVRFSPNALTGSFLDKVNSRLESQRDSGPTSL